MKTPFGPRPHPWPRETHRGAGAVRPSVPWYWYVYRSQSTAGSRCCCRSKSPFRYKRLTQMPVKHAIWKVGSPPQRLSEVSLETEQVLKDMIVFGSTNHVRRLDAYWSARGNWSRWTNRSPGHRTGLNARANRG